MFKDEVYLTPINLHPLSYLDDLMVPAQMLTGEDLRRLRYEITKAEHFKDFVTSLQLCDDAIAVLPYSIEFRIKKAKLLVLTYQLEEAHKILDGIIKRFPTDAEALSVLGLTFYHQGNFNKCIEVCSSVLLINPMMFEAKIIRAKALKLKEIVKTRKLSMWKIINLSHYNSFIFQLRRLKPKLIIHG